MKGKTKIVTKTLKGYQNKCGWLIEDYLNL